jgi:hypothetical protein
MKTTAGIDFFATCEKALDRAFGEVEHGLQSRLGSQFLEEGVESSLA